MTGPKRAGGDPRHLSASAPDNERAEGMAAGRRWLVEAGETERANLAALFAGGFLAVTLSGRTYPHLAGALGGLADPSFVLDFSSSPFLTGFREAVIATFAEPG